MTPQELGRKWAPKDASALLDTFNAGLLEETHWCDLKRELTSNRETAKDLSSFSIDGGTIVIGIDEKKPNGEPRNPVTLKGLPEKIEQIAQWNVHPPLQISCTAVDSGDDDGKGYVIVHIPASPLAPHQVDSVYYARSDKTTIRMSEPEVERLYQRRTWWNRDASEMLGRHMATFPQFGSAHPPHLYVVASPVGGWPDMCRDLVSGADWRGKIEQLKFNISRDESLRKLRQGGHSVCSELSTVMKSGRGALMSNRPAPSLVNADRQIQLEISEDGELWLFHTAMGQSFNINGATSNGLRLDDVVVVTRELLTVARYISDRCGHSAMWDFGLGLDCLSSIRPIIHAYNPFYTMDHPGYPAADHQETTRANVLELVKTPGTVAERLAGRLYRTFDINDEKFLSIFSDESERTP